MFIALSSTRIQTFSNQLSLFVCFFFFITFCSRCGMEWDIACRATDDLFQELFYHLVRRSHFSTLTPPPPPPEQHFFSLGSWKKRSFKHLSKKKLILPTPIQSNAFVPLFYRFCRQTQQRCSCYLSGLLPSLFMKLP